MRRTQKHLAITVVALCLGLGTVLQAGAHEGPTRSDQLGDVHFSVSCADEAPGQIPPRHGAVPLLRLDAGQSGVRRDCQPRSALWHGVLGPGDDRGR